MLDRILNYLKLGIVCAVIISTFGVQAQVVSKANKNNLAAAKASLAGSFPREHIKLKLVNNAPVLSGTVSSSEIAYKVENIVKNRFKDVKLVNLLNIANSKQVMLRVKIGEVTKQVAATAKSFGGMKFSQSDMIRVFAEPTLVALSGSSAFFQSGGEYPVVSNDGVDFKPYGVKVSFTPTVVSQSKIRLEVYSEVSEMNQNKYVKSLGQKVPTIQSQKAKTTIELSPGESLMIAGLVHDVFNNGVRDNSELVIAVTPYLVNPVETKDIKLPTDKFYKHSDMEMKFLDNLSNNVGVPPSDISLDGPTGLIAE